MSNTKMKVVVMFILQSILNIDLIYTVTFTVVTLLTLIHDLFYVDRVLRKAVAHFTTRLYIFINLILLSNPKCMLNNIGK